MRAAATLSLRRIAAGLAPRIDAEVHPVSLLHSSGVDPRELGGIPAELLEPALLEFGRRGGKSAVLVPLFFGPSAALTQYLPLRLRAIQRHHPGLRLACASWLVADHDDSVHRIAEMLADAVRRVLPPGAPDPKVLLVDHGSPQREVTQVRNRLGDALRTMLGRENLQVAVASMERRVGSEYDFNEPLLERALRHPPFNSGSVVVALQFLQAGRHAGEAGDIALICAEAERAQPDLRTALTEPIGADVRLLGILARRYEEALRLPTVTA